MNHGYIPRRECLRRWISQLPSMTYSIHSKINCNILPRLILLHLSQIDYPRNLSPLLSHLQQTVERPVSHLFNENGANAAAHNTNSKSVGYSALNLDLLVTSLPTSHDTCSKENSSYKPENRFAPSQKNGLMKRNCKLSNEHIRFLQN